MVTKKKIKKYFERQFDELIQNLQNLNNIDRQKMHNIRLNLKKIRAVASFLKDCTHKKGFSVKSLKELFKVAGEIRTAQLNLETFKKYNIKDEAFLSNHQEIIESNALKLKNQSLDHIESIVKLRNAFYDSITDISESKVIRYYYSNIKVLSNNFRIIDENNLHDSRKIIKRLLYVLKILPESILAKLNLNTIYLDELQETIGKWHDTQDTLIVLSKAGIINGEGVSGLARQLEDQLETIIEQTRSFDANVMFAIKA